MMGKRLNTLATYKIVHCFRTPDGGCHRFESGRGLEILKNWIFGYVKYKRYKTSQIKLVDKLLCKILNEFGFNFIIIVIGSLHCTVNNYKKAMWGWLSGQGCRAQMTNFGRFVPEGAVWDPTPAGWIHKFTFFNRKMSYNMVSFLDTKEFQNTFYVHFHNLFFFVRLK